MATRPSRRGTSPWRDLRHIRDEMDRLIGSAFGRGEGEEAGQMGWSPETDMVERPDEYVVTAELPGMRREDVRVEMQDHALVIRGEKREEEERREGRRHLLERRFGSFTRSITLPESVDPARIHAKFEHGVLRVTLPKSEERRGREVKIEGGE